MSDLRAIRVAGRYLTPTADGRTFSDDTYTFKKLSATQWTGHYAGEDAIIATGSTLRAVATEIQILPERKAL